MVILGLAATAASVAGSSSARPASRHRHAAPKVHGKHAAARRPHIEAEPETIPALEPRSAELEPIVSTAPALPRSALDPQRQIRTALLDDALVALKRHGDRIANKDHIFLVDFQQHSSKPRLFKLDLRTGQVQSFRTAHGRGSDPSRTGFAKRFSNTPNSDASSVGAYVTAGQSVGARDGANVLLDGLDATNNQARARAVIVHGADYCEPGYLAREGMLGRSNGCFALSHADLKTLRPIMDSGRLIFAGN
ncbi:MAG: murein L,D-transpeptidase catalytic domain family protein [Proteobacteria bacterium]|nr:murein L,D-transpeptidase catalytic domain family protein [Pseudomonadota bacterium]